MTVNIKIGVDSPKIELNEENSVFLIEGYSYPADAYDTYEIVLNWIENSLCKIENQLICEFKLRMISSASRKMIYEILMALERAASQDKKILIHWYYEKYDEDMMEIGEDYADNVSLPFRFFQM